ncbi:MAG: TlpA family protein disulfide reductase, partial [Dongiaceae bacterium]
ILHDLAIVGLPVTLLVNAEGREIARAIGPVAWDEPEIVAFIEAHLGAAGPELNGAEATDGAPLAQSPLD